MWKKLGSIFLLLAFSLEAQSLSFSIKTQALQELDNIQMYNEQLLKITSDYETNYQMLKIDYDNIKALTQQQEKSLIAKDQALKNYEKSLKAYQIKEYMYWTVIGSIILYVILVK
jgi:hypothetical protein